jgi:hypothetical protein
MPSMKISESSYTGLLSICDELDDMYSYGRRQWGLDLNGKDKTNELDDKQKAYIKQQIDLLETVLEELDKQRTDEYYESL